MDTDFSHLKKGDPVVSALSDYGNTNYDIVHVEYVSSKGMILTDDGLVYLYDGQQYGIHDQNLRRYLLIATPELIEKIQTKKEVDFLSAKLEKVSWRQMPLQRLKVISGVVFGQ